MDDPELEAIRQRRMREIMAAQGGAQAGRGAGGVPSPASGQQDESQKREAEERRQMMLAQLMDSSARERLARIALVKPEKARAVEDLIIRGAQTGQLAERVSESRLITLLEQINEQTQQRTKVTIQRRRSALDDD
ncbi:hypothetical protein CLOM_g9959 [Closterium sp. NIES-68]|nr:hypothetical protein CLOM_g9959 [Closterium sp. NIES-68]GJP68443.1 hypothetical protein CLOP_g25149 [Closterium sp. NIES-67]